MYLSYAQNKIHTAILIIIKGQFQVFQRFSSSKLVLKTVESRFAALNYYENGSMHDLMHVKSWPWPCSGQARVRTFLHELITCVHTYVLQVTCQQLVHMGARDSG
jgi:hypothetical protein